MITMVRASEEQMASIPVKPIIGPPPLPETVQPGGETMDDRFRRLAAEWDSATAYLSSMEQAAKHPAYQEIIGMGKDVVPLLLRDLEQTERHWFIALNKITGANP